MSEAVEVQQTRKPADTPFKQQRLWAWQPILSPRWVIPCFCFIAAVFIPIGAAVVVASDNVQEIEVRYDTDFDKCPWRKGGRECLEQCATDPCLGTEECGMIGNLGKECPREFNNSWGQTAQTLRALSGCDPKCTKGITITIEETMEPPIFLYYKLTNFYQNHRRYAKSRSDKQLAGDSTNGEVSDCPPVKNPGTLTNEGWCQETLSTACADAMISTCETMTGDVCTKSTNRFPVGDLTYSPCGLVAWSTFNDSFTLVDSNNITICDGSSDADTNSCKKSGIAWDADRDAKFKEPKTNDFVLTADGFKSDIDKCLDGGSCSYWSEEAVMPYLYHGWYLYEPYHRIARPTDESFMVWMRTASLATFRKLYRRIERRLEPGTYTMIVDHRFSMESFSGKKYFVLSTLSWIGGRNYFLGIAYISIGVLCVVLAVIFISKHMFCRTHRHEVMASYQNTR
ncbi:ALA-interacting subunit 3 [Diplonema papillatum]|nr:ALA-interacting subunit 3 [Diplonema papillatum]